MAGENCFICEKPLEEEKTLKVMKRGIETMLKASSQRNDNKQKYLKNKDTVIVHVKCRKSYIHTKCILAAVKRRQSIFAPARTRSADNFDFQQNCIFCGKDASDLFLRNQSKKSDLKKREKVCRIREESTKESILKQSCNRQDNLSNKVMDRIVSVPNLITAKARYHRKCYARYFGSTTSKSNTVDAEEIPHAADIIHQYIQEHFDEHQFSLKKIVDDYTAEDPDNSFLKRKLYERLVEEIIITSDHGVEPIICLSDMSHKILIKHSEEFENRE